MYLLLTLTPTKEHSFLSTFSNRVNFLVFLHFIASFHFCFYCSQLISLNLKISNLTSLYITKLHLFGVILFKWKVFLFFSHFFIYFCLLFSFLIYFTYLYFFYLF